MVTASGECNPWLHAASLAQEARQILDSIDVNGNSKIDYEEFIAATLHFNKLNREENMYQVRRAAGVWPLCTDLRGAIHLLGFS